MSVLSKHMHNAPAFFGKSPENKAKRRAEKSNKKKKKKQPPTDENKPFKTRPTEDEGGYDSFLGINVNQGLDELER